MECSLGFTCHGITHHQYVVMPDLVNIPLLHIVLQKLQHQVHHLGFGYNPENGIERCSRVVEARLPVGPIEEFQAGEDPEIQSGKGRVGGGLLLGTEDLEDGVEEGFLSGHEPFSEV
ncbi:30S ribosomal protein S7 [Striga asiatica]|uniref:30S ribosomal protein S7 n=1 Tax=Striga asiatica TaxID=4170 RepID=A0A5A7RH16_STRAF|nr:30S ribosomal protein S7 [Striga asiatica]